MGTSQSKVGIIQSEKCNKRIQKVFPDFHSLSEEIVLEMYVSHQYTVIFLFPIKYLSHSSFLRISFVAQGPMENEDETNIIAPLTHVIPLVCKNWNYLIKTSDILWVSSLQRIVYQNPNVFKEGFLLYLNSGKSTPPWSVFYQEAVDRDDYLLAASVRKMESLSKKQMFELVSSIYDSISSQDSNEYKQDIADRNSELSCARSLYITLIKNHSFTTFPIFHMPFNGAEVGMHMTLNIFEPRYRMLVIEAMDGRSIPEQSGRLIKLNRPRFIFANERELRSGSDGFLVEICRCTMLEGARAKIKIHFLRRVELKQLRLRPSVENGLYEARIRRFHDCDR